MPIGGILGNVSTSTCSAMTNARSSLPAKELLQRLRVTLRRRFTAISTEAERFCFPATTTTTTTATAARTDFARDRIASFLLLRNKLFHQRQQQPKHSNGLPILILPAPLHPFCFTRKERRAKPLLHRPTIGIGSSSVCGNPRYFSGGSVVTDRNNHGGFSFPCNGSNTSHEKHEKEFGRQLHRLLTAIEERQDCHHYGFANLEDAECIDSWKHAEDVLGTSLRELRVLRGRAERATEADCYHGSEREHERERMDVSTTTTTTTILSLLLIRTARVRLRVRVRVLPILPYP
mmetsp:Transcript_7473/g.14656  ORF Transcript_7473/g.14656 Transcript_7473/m.14656 type:complete len:291 (+) Transcript_7473:170-1042(+)